MSESLFADGVAEIAVVAGVVRLQFFTIQKTDRSGQPERKVSFTLNLPMEGFANSMPGLQQLFDKMVKDGIVKPRSPGGSPNFQ